MKTLVITVSISALLAFIAWALPWITLLETVAAVIAVLLTVLVAGRLREQQ